MKLSEFILKLKMVYWRTPIEIKEWIYAVISLIPGHTGEFVRRKYFLRCFKKCGQDLTMATCVTIRNPQKLEIADNVYIMQYVFINAGGKVSIGKHTIIGPHVKIWSVNHKFDRIDMPIWDQGWNVAPVDIENDVWIGTGAIILPGVTIGKGSIIGAGAVISKSVPNCSIVVGNPGKIIGSRIKEG